jgi:hypothetical protein
MSNEYAIARRILLIPFLATFKDKKLTNIPEIVINETEKYISESNSFGEMINDLCEIDKNNEKYYVGTSELLKMCQDKYKYKGNPKTLAKDMKEQGFDMCIKYINRKTCRVYQGLKFRIEKDELDRI